MTTPDVYLPRDADAVLEGRLADVPEYRRVPGPVVVTATGVVHQMGCPRAAQATGSTLTVNAASVLVPDENPYSVCPLCHR